MEHIDNKLYNDLKHKFIVHQIKAIDSLIRKLANTQSKSSDITKTEAADKADKIYNNSDNERNAADYPNTSKTTKPGSATKIKFEEEANKAEKADKMLDASLFVRFLTDFFDESDDAMLVTSDDNDRGKWLADVFA